MSLHFGRSLGPFAVGQSLLTVTEMIHSRFPNSNASILFDKTASSSPSHAIIVLVTGLKKDLYVLRFDPALQILRSVAYSLPPSSSAGKTDAQEIHGTRNLSLKRAFTIRDIVDNFGRPKAFTLQSCREGGAKAAFLVYDGACLVFQLRNPEHGEVKNVQELSELKSRLFEVRVAPKDDDSTAWKGLPLAKVQLTDFNLPVVRLVVHGISKVVTGLQIFCSSDDQSDGELPAPEATRVVCFGDRCEDVLSALGTPDEAYYKDSRHSESVGVLGNSQIVSKQSGLKSDFSYAYRHLGIDVLFDSGKNAVSKFVLHSNVPDHYEFCHYSRCFFKFSASKDCISSSGDNSSSSSEELLVTAATNWNVVRTHVDSSLTKRLRTCHYGPSTNSTFPFPDTNLWALFNQFVVEVTYSNSIAKLTILSPPQSAILQSRSAHNTAIARPRNTPLPVREVETSVTSPVVSEPDRQTSRETDSDDEFQDCQEDSFHSAESSLADRQIPPTQPARDTPRTVTTVHKAFFSSNINVVILNQSSDSPRTCAEEATSPAMSVTFEFQGDDDSDGNESSNATSVMVTTSTYSPDSPEVTDSLLSDVEVQSHSSREHSPELGSFDFVSFSEIPESQEAVADVSPSDHEPSPLRNVPSDRSETVDSSTVTQAGIISPSGGRDHSQALRVEELDLQGQSKTGDEGSKGTSVSQEMTASSPESSFQYQPQPAAMTASRTMALSQDIGLLMKSTHSPSREPSAAAASNVHVTRPPQKKVGRVPNVGYTSRARTKPDQKGSSKAIAKGTTKPSPSAVSPTASKRQPRKLIVQQRAGSSMSAREEAHQRLLSHTKSSQQRIKQKYVPKKVAAEDVREEEEEEEGRKVDEEEGEGRKVEEGEGGREDVEEKQEDENGRTTTEELYAPAHVSKKEEEGEGKGGEEEGEGKGGEEEGEGRRGDIEEKQDGENGDAVVEVASRVEVLTAALTMTTEELYVPEHVEEATTEPTDTRDDSKPTLLDPLNHPSTDDAAILSITKETTIATELHQDSLPPAVSEDPPKDDAHGSTGAVDLGMPTISEMSNESGDSHNTVVLPLPLLPGNPHCHSDAASNSQSPPSLPLPVTEVHHAEVSQTTQSAEAAEPRLTSAEAASEHSESKDPTPTVQVAAGRSADTTDSTEDVQSQLLRSGLGEGSASGTHEEHQSKLVRDQLSPIEYYNNTTCDLTT